MVMVINIWSIIINGCLKLKLTILTIDELTSPPTPPSPVALAPSPG
jgi:hypothetical protein